MTSLRVDPNDSVFLFFSWSRTSLVRCFLRSEWQSWSACSFSYPSSTYLTSSSAAPVGTGGSSGCLAPLSAGLEH